MTINRLSPDQSKHNQFIYFDVITPRIVILNWANQTE